MRSIHFVLGASLMLSAGTAVARERLTGEARLTQALAGRVAGKPVNCIMLRGTESSEIIEGVGIVYRQGSTLYLNRPRSGADSLDRDDILVTRLYSGNLCSVDVVNLIDRNSRFQRGFVSLGEFVPYRKPAKTAAR